MELWSFSRALGGDAAELRGMSVEALDGKIGKVDDVVEQIGGAYLIVDTGPWIFGKTVMLPAGVVTAVDTNQGSVFIDRARDDVKNAPEHDPDAADNRAQREALTAYYGAGRASESSSAVGPASDADASGLLAGGPPATSFGRPDHDQTDTPPTPSFGRLSDADEGQVSESESPAAIGGGSGQPDDRSSESLGSETGDASTTPGSKYDAPALQPSGVVPSQRPVGSPEQPQTGITPTSGFIPSEPGGAPADESQSDQVETSEGAATTGAASEATSQQPSTDRIPRELEEEQPGHTYAASAEEQPGHTEEATARRRFARDTGSSASKSETKSRSGGKSGRNGASRKSSDEVPIAGYDSLTAAQVVARLRKLSQRELANAERYEKRHESRRTVLSRIESLREDEPWRGYDDATVDEVRKKLDADEGRARAVRDYERRHRRRKGVMEAARRTVASA